MEFLRAINGDERTLTLLLFIQDENAFRKTSIVCIDHRQKNLDLCEKHR
ncbi:MAG: hypothetical protein ABF377_11740 [Akkermansiaceae bacterium]